MLPKEYCFAPSVFAVRDSYIVCVALSTEATVCVRVGGETFYDSSNGILRSKKYLHMVEVPQELLDNAGEYTIISRTFIERKPYFPTSEEPVEYTVSFKGVTEKENINISYVSDTHGHVEEPSRSAAFFGDDLDILVLGGDMANDSGSTDNFKTLFNIAGNVTAGTRPCIFSRGNHDLRGQYAEVLADYTPTDNGRSYYTVKLGPVWALVLDCGEDKDDACSEYGHSVACHDFRVRETRFIRKVIENSANEYQAKDVKHRLLLSHVPFAERYNDPFNPEEEIYTEWCRLCRESIKPELWLSGHKHVAEVSKPGGARDHFGQPCTCIIGSKPDYQAGSFVSANIILSEKSTTVIFTDNNGNEIQRELV